MSRLVTLDNFNFMALNGPTNLLVLGVTYLAYCVLSWPFNLWQQLSFYAPCFTALWMFQNSLLCPSEANDYSGVFYPPATFNFIDTTTEGCVTFGMIVFALMAITVSQYVGKRTGAVLSTIIRSAFFVVVTYWIYFSLISIRLMMV